MDDDWKGIPSHWAIYVLVEDCDAAAAKVQELARIFHRLPVQKPPFLA
jgi:predicted enzyme related to lactoylglutathione lyase